MITRSRFFASVVTLTAAALGMRFAGMLFNLYLSTHIGTAGLGRFSLVMSVYGFALTAAAAGIGLAVTRAVSEGDVGAAPCKTARVAMRTAIRYSLITGFAAAVLLLLFSAPIAGYCLHDTDAIPALRVLALSLPPAALSSAFGGYFIARHRAEYGAVVNVTALLFRMTGSLFLLRCTGEMRFSPTTALAVGCLLSEGIGFLCAFCLYRYDTKHRLSDAKTEDANIPACRCEVTRIAVPIAVTACIRAGLGTVLHLLIPVGLKRSGMGEQAALSAYGTVHGMVLPMLLLPLAFFTSAASLLVPEIAASHASGDDRAVRCLQKRVLSGTLWLAVLAAGICFCFGKELGAQFCDAPDAGHYIRMLAPLEIVMFMDTMVDAFLKGLDEQVASMRYNILDAAFSVLMAIVLLPRMGSIGYIVLLYASETFNLVLSAHKLHRVMPAALSIPKTLAKAILAFWISRALARVFSVLLASVGVSFRFADIQTVIAFSVMVLSYGLFLRHIGGIFPQKSKKFRASSCFFA